MRGEKDFHRRLRRYLTSIGATSVDFSVTGGTHVRCVFKYDDRRYTLFCSATPRADGWQKSMCQAKRLIRQQESRQ